MKVTEQKEDVTVGGAQSTEAFTIKASAKAFSILSSNLYSNVLGAVIRELCTNAFDAHVMTDKAGEPFVISLPNSLDPTFRVRDFGPGLTPAEITQVYTTFFESTKTDSNDVVGCLGLGSKSPFGIADSFSINSYQNGKKTIYSAFLNDARIPTIAKFGEMDTDEEDGLELEVGIKEEDFSSFNREVNSQLKYFIVKPIVKGNSSFEWNVDEEYLYEGTNWKMVGGNNRGRNGDGARVIQGQIAYPIDTNAMGKYFENASPVVQEVLKRNILFAVNIGDVNIAPSREALTYDDRTSENIVKAAEKIVKELPQIIKDKIQSAVNEYDARLMFAAVMNNLGSGYYNTKLKEVVVKSGEILWNGKDVSKLTIFVKEDDLQTVVAFKKNYNGRYSKNIQSVQVHSGYHPQPDEKFHWNFEARSLSEVIWIYATEDDKSVDGRSKQYANDNMNSSGVVNIITTKLTRSQLADRLGLPTKQIVVAADLDKVRRTSGSNVVKGKREFVLQEFNPSHYNNTKSKTNVWQLTPFDKVTDAVGLYVELDRYDVLDQEGNHVGDLAGVKKAAKELGIIDADTRIFGLRKSVMKKPHNLKNLFAEIEAKVKNVTLEDRVVWGEDMEVVNKLNNNGLHLQKIKAGIAVDSPLQAILDKIIAQKTTGKQGYETKRMIEKYGIKPKIIDMSTQSAAADKLYHMFRMFNYYATAEDMIKYINDVDELVSLRELFIESTKSTT